MSFVHQIICIWSRLHQSLNTAHMTLACSFRHHTSASNLNWDVLNDSDFKAWVKYFGMPCSGPDTFTSPYTKPSLVLSLSDGYFKASHAKSSWFARLKRRDRVLFAWPSKFEGKSTWDCTRNIPSIYKHLYFWEHMWLSSPRAYWKEFICQ